MNTPDGAELSRSFDLTAEPWVPVVRLSGEPDLVNLADLLRQAHEFRRIAAEAPTMTAALHRLVIALFHRVYGPSTETAWVELWQDGRLPAEPLRQYLDRHPDRFDLFHPERPFLQCPGLSTLAPSSPGKLVPYRAVGNNVTLFDHTTSSDRLLLSPAEAARWLVTAQAFDPGGMKTPYQKDKSSEKAPGNSLGIVLVEGKNLKETLLLNALVYEPELEKPAMTTVADAPAWERAAPPPTPDKRTARGWTDLLTWPSRRILLSVDRTSSPPMVDGVVLTPGTRLDVRLSDEEKMAAFRIPRDTKGKPKRDVPLLPVRLRQVRGIWRHSVELLLVDLWEEQKTRQRPPALDQIAQLAEHLPADTVYTLRVFGQQLDSKASVVEAWLEEEVPAPVALVRAKDESLGALLGCAITLADEAGSALRALQTEYRRELRAKVLADIDLGYWPQLPGPFGEFLVRLGEVRNNGRSEHPVARRWGHTVEELARTTADRWATGASTEASKLMVLGKHMGRFRSRLATARHRFLADTHAYSTGTEEPGD